MTLSPNLFFLLLNVLMIHYFCAGDVYGFIQMERKDGAAAAGCIKHCIWHASNEVDFALRYQALG